MTFEESHETSHVLDFVYLLVRSRVRKLTLPLSEIMSGALLGKIGTATTPEAVTSLPSRRNSNRV